MTPWKATRAGAGPGAGAIFDGGRLQGRYAIYSLRAEEHPAVSTALQQPRAKSLTR